MQYLGDLTYKFTLEEMKHFIATADKVYFNTPDEIYLMYSDIHTVTTILHTHYGCLVFQRGFVKESGEMPEINGVGIFNGEYLELEKALPKDSAGYYCYTYRPHWGLLTGMAREDWGEWIIDDWSVLKTGDKVSIASLYPVYTEKLNIPEVNIDDIWGAYDKDMRAFRYRGLYLRIVEVSGMEQYHDACTFEVVGKYTDDRDNVPCE